MGKVQTMTDQELRDYLTGFMENETVDYVMGVVKQQQLAILDQVRMEEHPRAKLTTYDEHCQIEMYDKAVEELNQRIDNLQATLKGEQHGNR